MTISAQPATHAEEGIRTTWERLRAIVAQESDLPIHQIVHDLDWRMLDFSTMNMGTIKMVIEQEFGVRISLKEIYREPNFGSLAAYLEFLMDDTKVSSSERR